MCLLDRARTTALSSEQNKSLAYILCKQTLNLSYTGSISPWVLESVESNYLWWKRRAQSGLVLLPSQKGRSLTQTSDVYTAEFIECPTQACGWELPAVWRAGWSWLQSCCTGQRSCSVSCSDMNRITTYDEGVFRSHLIIQPFKVHWICLTKRGLQSKVVARCLHYGVYRMRKSWQSDICTMWTSD